MTSTFFNTHLINAGSRLQLADTGSRFHLDKNEQSNDVDAALKLKMMDALMYVNWNRYPSNDNSDIEKNVANYCGLLPENIVLSSGSANLITTLLNYFALNKKNIVITQPSYSLFDYHCKTYNIPYDAWMLSKDLKYDLQTMPELDSNSVLVITAPNNPTGNSISIEQLENILIENPESIIIVDGVYTEFGKSDFTPLVKKYENLIILRSFSKAFPIAGLRLGYLCASPAIATIVKKLVLQFSINHFTLIFAREILFSQEFMDDSMIRVKEIIVERERMYNYMRQTFINNLGQVFESEGNFLLIKINDTKLFEKIFSGLNHAGIKILNATNFSLLKNTFRVSVGNANENDAFLYCLTSIIKEQSKALHKTLIKNIQIPVALLQATNAGLILN